MWAIKRSIACNNIEHLTASDGAEPLMTCIASDECP
jgi:hypothetical protein